MVIYNWPSIVFFAVFYAVSITAIILKVVDKGLSVLQKVIWVAVIVLLPVIGIIAWAVYSIYRRLRRTPTTL